MTDGRDAGMATGTKHTVSVTVEKRPDYSYHVVVESSADDADNPAEIGEAYITACENLMCATVHALMHMQHVPDWDTGLAILNQLAEKRRASEGIQ